MFGARRVPLPYDRSSSACSTVSCAFYFLFRVVGLTGSPLPRIVMVSLPSPAASL